MATVDEIVSQIEQLSVLDLVDLTKRLQDRWGVSAAAAMPMMAAMPASGAPAAAAAPAEEAPTEFNVILSGLADPGKKINVIKVVRELTGLGLKEAKDVVEGVPQPIKEGASKEESDSIRAKLVEAGATVDVKPA
jgi:large subunit ribosomal protein L7/L12